MKTFTSHSLKETSDFACGWLEKLSVDFPAASEAVVAGLSGDLGAGKTTFVKALAKHLGISEEITSPTFVIMKIYPTSHPKFKKLIHIDAYRLESGKEFEVLNFEKLVADKDNLIVIEWPENVKSALVDLKYFNKLSFKIDDTGGHDDKSENTRMISEG